MSFDPNNPENYGWAWPVRPDLDEPFLDAAELWLAMKDAGFSIGATIDLTDAGHLATVIAGPLVGETVGLVSVEDVWAACERSSCRGGRLIAICRERLRPWREVLSIGPEGSVPEFPEDKGPWAFLERAKALHTNKP